MQPDVIVIASAGNKNLICFEIEKAETCLNLTGI